MKMAFQKRDSRKARSAYDRSAAVSRAGRRLRSLQNRRGATIVLVAVALVPLLGLGALAIDLSLWQVGATQLQTAADAAALAGARAAQLYPTTAAVMSVQYAQNIATQNRAFGAAVTLPSSAVEPVRWTPPVAPATQGTVTSASWTGTGTGLANAVRVTVAAQSGSFFIGITSNAAPTVQRSAVAWIANINNGCIKPFALPYSVLYNRSAALAGLPLSTAASPPDLVQRQLSAIASSPAAARVVILRGPTVDSTRALGSALTVAPNPVTYRGNDGQFSGYSFTGNAGGPGYRNSIPSCQNVSTTVDDGTTLPGNNDIECFTIVGLMGNGGNCAGSWPTGAVSAAGATCVLRPADGTTWDAGCYTSTGNPAPLGRTVRVAWGDNIGAGSNAVNYRVVGEFLLLCAFRGAAFDDKGNPTGHIETCNSGQLPAPANYPRGTIVGVLQGLSTPELNPGTQLGNDVGDQQRLILVR
jgi:Flp pilus assembly protein TadG